MTRFSSFERMLSRRLRRFPRIKRSAKRVYQRTIYPLYRKTSNLKSDREITLIGPDRCDTFFGYYDKSPESNEGYVLCHMAAFATRVPPRPENPVQVALFSPDNLREPVFTREVTSYNWQQGCRLQWVGDDEFLFNIYDGERNRYRSVLIDRKNGKVEHIFDEPVQDAFGLEFYISLNYDRLNAFAPDYGYRNRNVGSRGRLPDLDEDGILHVCMKTGKTVLLYSFTDLCKVDYDPLFDDADHTVNHLMISPNGDKFLLLHRYFVRGRRFDRLLLASVGERSLKLIARNGMVSHYGWIDNDSIIAYLGSSMLVDGYFLISTRDGTRERFGNGSLDGMGDGHPHVNGGFFVTDTYPDRARMQKLILADHRRQNFRLLAEFHHGFGFGGECRCDLHPRFSPGGDRVYFDSVHSGARRMARMEIRQGTGT